VRVLVCGSRDWEDIHAIRMRLLRLPPTSEIIHGGAPGADRVAAWLAEDFGFAVREYKADWSRGKRGGPERNIRMLDQRPQLVLAFQRNGSRGTQHTIDEARRRGIPVEIVTSPVPPRFRASSESGEHSLTDKRKDDNG
jgi:hypothetical protein